MRWLLLAVLASGCAAPAVLLHRPFTKASGDPNAPADEDEIGVAAYRSASVWGVNGRAEGYGLMKEACHGPYRVESEDSNSDFGDWRKVRFRCLNGDPRPKPSRLRTALLNQIRTSTGCPPDYVTVLGWTGETVLHLLACQQRYDCDVTESSVDCRVSGSAHAMGEQEEATVRQAEEVADAGRTQ